MTLEEKFKEVLDLVGVVFPKNKDPEEMSATEVREAYRKAMIFITGVLIGNVITYDKIKELGKEVKKQT